MSISVSDIVQFMESLAPPSLAEEWDNVGLLLGDPGDAVESVMTCLTLTPDVAGEAIRRRAGLVITHHPILFRAVQRLTSATPEGTMLLELIRAGVGVYSPHTSFDNGAGGINQWLAHRLCLDNILPLRPRGDLPALGAGRWGELPERLSWEEFQKRILDRYPLSQFQSVGGKELSIQRVGIACGAAAEFLADAHEMGCEAFITGEARFHACLEARSLGVGLVLLGHYASERPALEMLAEQIAAQFPQLTAWASEEESDPLEWVSSP